MSVLAALDATRVCARASAQPDSAWVRAAPAPVRQVTPACVVGYSWWSFVRNPQAMLVTGLVGAAVTRDALLRIAREARRRS
jgi:hypothetical protein